MNINHQQYERKVSFPVEVDDIDHEYHVKMSKNNKQYVYDKELKHEVDLQSKVE